jgi:hypothetical protein
MSWDYYYRPERRRASMIFWEPAADGTYVVVIVVGAAMPQSGIARFAVEGPAGAVATVSSQDGHFVAELPGAPARGHPPAGGPFYVVGYTAADRAVTSTNLTQAIIDGQPPS